MKRTTIGSGSSVMAKQPRTMTHTSGLSEDDAEIATALCDSSDPLEHLLGELLGYWGRERLADSTAKMHALRGKKAALMENPGAIWGLHFERLEEALGRSAPLAVFSFPEQSVGREIIRARGVFIAKGLGQHSQATLARFDEAGRTLALRWTPARAAEGFYPDRLVADDWVNPTPKPQVLFGLGQRLLAGRPLNQVTLDLLGAAPPRFVAGGGPAGGVFTDDVDDAMDWIGDLDGGYVAVQGPPGTGKTYTGAHLIYTLIMSGKRVGVTAMSHSATENLLEAVVELFAARGESDKLRAAKRGTSTGLSGVACLGSNKEAASRAYNLIAGTTWLFASEDVLASPVDTLVIDEAGQLSLADAIVASLAARNVVLLGDPQQLPQVAQATHPGGSGDSVLDHVLEGATVVDPTRGVFLATTRRMHPSITEYISERFYDGQLASHATCGDQSVVGLGVGLRHLEVEHDDCTTGSVVEAEAIAATIAGLMGSLWTDAAGRTAPLGAEDFMVVAPFNDQVDLIRATLEADPLVASVPVGTVDKFQGREAAVVFFSMTTSSQADLTRGVEFLFSPNRLNVAISRARCVAYVVSTVELLNKHPDPESNLLIANVTDLVDRAS